MRSDELVTAAKLAGMIPDSSPDYTTARLLLELTDVQRTVFAKAIVASRGGYWLRQSTTATVAGTTSYRMPPRAVVGGLEKIEILDAGGKYRRLVDAGLRDSGALENLGSGLPMYYVVVGDYVRLLPTPSAAETIRWTFYMRPSQLVTEQVSATSRGKITAVTPATPSVTVDVIPYNQTIATPAAIVTGNPVDVVKPNGWHELALFDATATISGLVISFPAGTDVSRCAVGDYVRYQEQSDWPCLPDDFHRTLSDAAAVVYLSITNQMQKAQALGSKVGSDMERFVALMSPRVKDSPKIIRQRYGLARIARGVYGR